MSSAAEIEIIVQNFHRSAYRHFERSTECLSQRSLHLVGCSALPCARLVGLPVKSKNWRRKIQKNRTVHKTLCEVARKLSSFVNNSKSPKQRKICSKIDDSKARDGSNPAEFPQKIPSMPDIDGSPFSYSNDDAHDYFGDTSRIHSIVLMQGKLMERAQVELSGNEIALN
jgi:hypothetical protein